MLGATTGATAALGHKLRTTPWLYALCLCMGVHIRSISALSLRNSFPIFATAFACACGEIEQFLALMQQTLSLCNSAFGTIPSTKNPPQQHKRDLLYVLRVSLQLLPRFWCLGVFLEPFPSGICTQGSTRVRTCLHHNRTWLCRPASLQIQLTNSPSLLPLHLSPPIATAAATAACPCLLSFFF